MGEVVAFRKERKTTLRGDARRMLKECFTEVRKPTGFVVFVTGENGKMVVRFCGEPDLMPFDLLARAEAMAQTEKIGLLNAGFAEDEESAGD